MSNQDTFSDSYIENIYYEILLNIDNFISNQKYHDIFNATNNKTTNYYINQGFSVKESFALSMTTTFLIYLNI